MNIHQSSLKSLRAADHHDRLDFLLQSWADWMRASGSNQLAYPSRSPIIGISHGADFDQIYDKVTNQTAEAVDGCVQSLGTVEQKSLRCEYLNEVWRYRSPINHVLALARETLQSLLNKRGIS